MLIPKPRKSALLSLPLLLTSLPAMATPLGTAEMFNAYSRTTFNYSNTDIQGVIGAGGNISYGGGDTGQLATSANPYTIYSGGTVTLTNHDVKNGGIQAAGNITTTNTTLAGNVVSRSNVAIVQGGFGSVANPAITSTGNVQLSNLAMTNGAVATGGNFANSGGSFNGSTLILGPGATTTADGWYLAQGTVSNGAVPVVNLLDHQQVYDDLLAASEAFANLSANGSVGHPLAGQLTLTGNDAVNVFSVDGNDLANLSRLTFGGARDATYIINVAGMDIDFGNPAQGIGGFYYFLEQMMVGSFDDFSSKIIFNFLEATTLDIHGSIFGTILAPYANVTTQNGVLNGSLYGYGIDGTSQINNIAFRGETGRFAPVGSESELPEPSSLALLGLGLLPLLRGAKSNQRRAG